MKHQVALRQASPSRSSNPTKQKARGTNSIGMSFAVCHPQPAAVASCSLQDIRAAQGEEPFLVEKALTLAQAQQGIAGKAQAPLQVSTQEQARRDVQEAKDAETSLQDRLRAVEQENRKLLAQLAGLQEERREQGILGERQRAEEERRHTTVLQAAEARAGHAERAIALSSEEALVANQKSIALQGRMNALLDFIRGGAIWAVRSAHCALGYRPVERGARIGSAPPFPTRCFGTTTANNAETALWLPRAGRLSARTIPTSS